MRNFATKSKRLKAQKKKNIQARTNDNSFACCYLYNWHKTRFNKIGSENTCHNLPPVQDCLFFKKTSATTSAAFESEAGLDNSSSIKFSVVRKLRLALVKSTSAKGT